MIERENERDYPALVSTREIRKSIPTDMPDTIRKHIEASIFWLEAMEARESGDARLIEAQKNALMATIGLYQMFIKECDAFRQENRQLTSILGVRGAV